MKVAAILPFAVAALAAVSRRQNPGDDLDDNLVAITAATNALAETVQNFDGDAVPLATDTQTVFNAIGDAQNTIDAVEGNLTIDQLIALQAPTNDLNDAVKTAIDNTIAQKDALVAACLGPTVYTSLLNQQSVSAQLVDSIAAKSGGLDQIVRQSSAPAAADLERGVEAFADAQGCATSTTTTTTDATTTTAETTTTGDAETTTTGDAETTTTGDATSTTTSEEAPIYPTDAPVYPTDGAPYPNPSQEHPSTYPISSTEYETSYVTYCPLTSTKTVDNKPVPTTYYGWSTVTVTIYPTEHPAPTYPASSTEYVTYYETYAPVTTTLVIDNKPVPTTIAVYTTVTVTVAPVKTACPSPAVYTHPAAPAAPAAPAETKPADAVQQIGDGQIQNPAKPGEASPIQQINDGQIQNPAKPADASPAKPAEYPGKPAGYPAKPTNGTGYAKPTSPATPETYTGAASKASIFSFGAVFVAAVGVAAF